MLVRAARRHPKLRLARSVEVSYRQLQLPWLCPAVASVPRRGRSTQTATVSTSGLRPRSRSRSQSSKHHATRHLATAVDAGPAHSGLTDEYVPFEHLSSPKASKPSPPPNHDLSSLRPLNGDDVVMLPVSEDIDPAHFRRWKFSSIAGDTADVQQNLYACIKVGRLDRAAALVRRLVFTHQPDSAEVLDGHHQYMTALLDVLMSNPTHQNLLAMQKWFELDIRGRNIPPTSSMIALLIKASFQVLEGTKFERTARRYLNVARQTHGEETEFDVLSSTIFTDAEFSRLIRMFPHRFSNVDIPHPISVAAPNELKPDQIQIDPNSTPSRAPIAAWKPPNPYDKEKLEIRPVEQKGQGLTALKRSLGSMYIDAEEEQLLSSGQKKDSLHLEQERLEQDVLDSALQRWRDEAENAQYDKAKGKLTQPSIGAHVHKWVVEMDDLVKNEIKKAEAEELEEKVSVEEADRILLSPFLKLVSPERLSAAAVLGYITAISDIKKPDAATEVPTANMVNKIGRPVAEEIQLESEKSYMLEKWQSLPSRERRQKLAIMTKVKRRFIPNALGPVIGSQIGENRSAVLNITPAIKSKLGALFLSLIMKTAKIPVTRVDPRTNRTVYQLQPVVTHAFKWREGKKIGLIKTNQELINRLKKEPVASFLAKHLPMIVEPKSWDGLQPGPYLQTPVSAVRYKDRSRSQHEYLSMAAIRGDLKQVFAGLDVIGKIPWRINAPVFKILTEAWNTGEQIGGLAPENPIPEFPTKPADTENRKAYHRWRTLVKDIENETNGYHSQRCYQNFQLEVARAYLDRTFYTPHNIDFRGRAYPIPPYFNHMGADHVRGLFLFADGKELGETGLRWLKIHLANIFGFDKESLKDREAFTMDHLHDIYDSATNPLNGNRWWLSAGDPWQCLAACIELKNALDFPIPTKFVSHLPIHQDGTCNGLQHYAALGGDLIGARQVNLMPGDRPADIYSGVAEIVKKEIDELARQGDREAQLLEGKVTRKVVKQPVMTNVYGVTHYGANLQVRKQLVDIMPRETLDNDIHLGHLSRKIATGIFKALSQMFTGAHAIQEWLGECGARISQAVTPEQIERIIESRAERLEQERMDKEEGNNSSKPAKSKKKKSKKKDTTSKDDYQFKSTIVWTTPLGMPVVQPYRKPSYRVIKTKLQDIQILQGRLSDPVNQARQLQAFPPNFIHSLDATHMLLSALKCKEIGLTFSAVHDSFWTHAADVPVMNRILRDAFVRMHTEDIIGRLREEFVARYKGCLHYAPIPMNSAVSKKIRKWRKIKGNKSMRSFEYKIIKTEAQLDELLEEYERLTLLNSDDPEDRERGAQMVTPGSIVEEAQDPSLVSSDHSEGFQLLGKQLEEADNHESHDDNTIELTTSEGEREDSTSEFSSQETSNETGKTDEVTSSSQPNETDELNKQKKQKEKERKRASRYLYVWMPIQFPTPPAKGDFDVRKLKDSQYFFS